ncbi:uncharacterized protein LACBIDRAFT_316405 [Laccaria bicolor S238N-H82]|uniref:Predicted protein n=1 Tax=Laccaria bicolor (strain S238N-H82 / ATCC MYA-4686) TaxID=486041 RepID=B0E0W0_LACBS|nr:uncharacterized protein LACBIDRAFT_316405 [Laccaria bicolor S238N-H82]EDQ99468.1 predicted protein [Laccaria bicolor S238N-H82]|eukprot:XP_001889817.1 predicted protein [Laccaria bicolor S238N-H82]
MSVRRRPSTTSLSKYLRFSTPDLQPQSVDFCNAFLGLGDGVADVLFARMQGAARTVKELKNFWKERCVGVGSQCWFKELTHPCVSFRAAIEEDYAKRLTKLSKMVLGTDEIGELRNSLNAVKFETERQCGIHLNLAQQIHSDLESPAAAIYTRRLQHKKVAQAAIEKDFKTKQTQETYANKAREKYEADCMRINSYTAQSSLVQGKDMKKVSIKVERAQQTVQINERDFANFSKALQDTFTSDPQTISTMGTCGQTVTHSEELWFWLFLVNSGTTWFRSLYFKTWVVGSCIAVIYTPRVIIFTRHDPLVRHEGVDTGTIVRLAEFSELKVLVNNLLGNISCLRPYSQMICVVFRFLFTIPILILGFDGVRPHHIINEVVFWTGKIQTRLLGKKKF